jgi:ethanolamine ammonia-lyase large subunit
MLLRTKLHGKTYEFPDIRLLMGKANEEKSGDRLAGVAAETAAERAAARLVLAEVPLWVLRENPAAPYEQDEVTRVIHDALNERVYGEIKGWTVGQLREWILADTTTPEMIRRVANGLTAEMIAAVVKLMSNLDLIYGASKLRVTAHCNNTIGAPGTLSSRNQPNHPTDSPEGIRAEVYEGLSYGSGDSVIGINPVDDSYSSVARLLEMTYDVIKTWQIPTQNCVLSHVTTQMKCLEAGAPVGLVFQSLAGSQKGNESFGISVQMLDEADALARKHCFPTGPNYMYFETGQGSELSADAHHGWDQVTMEARCYGLAKRYHPFQVNTVVGFIGPEYLYDARQIQRAGLEDHFMGKLTGIPDGRRCVLHQPRPRRPERHREPGGAAHCGGLQLLHGRAHGRRFDAVVPEHVIPRRADAAPAFQAAPCAGVRVLAGGVGADKERRADREGGRSFIFLAAMNVATVCAAT